METQFTVTKLTELNNDSSSEKYLVNFFSMVSKDIYILSKIY